MLGSKKARFFIFIFATLFFLQNNLRAENTVEFEPLYAGTQLAFYSTNAAPGHLSIQPYVFAIRKYGFYNPQWKLPSQKHIDEVDLFLSLETGITSSLDFTLDVNAKYDKFGHRHSYLYGDTNIYFAWQALQDKKKTWIPDLRLLLGESFPTGKHDHLNPEKGRSDISGTGAYATTFLLVLGKTFYALPTNPFDFNLNLYYIVSTKTHVKGFNLYGGAGDTHGMVKPGDQFIANLGIEFSFDRNWAIGTDIHYVHQNKSTFTGNKGKSINGSTPLVGFPSSEQLSLAPCVEYSWNEDLSVAFGPWFTVAGRNSVSFMSAVANVFYYF